ncbi:LuxR C-terminal-related transcriptional regulator [Paenibacillus soyae]|uniref:LuxR C-terminal-related transcriptional regulator n=1 Tax=Paenibacillus soyae TaxID=2969249 RepID=A0A9X2MQJ2_9BACL|nr:LuxR C-terminal-related transcriptional regulator [Paenibacillus soyae]MCR2804565.1 LuxR C-terminal-related transcriptional regulator [Paenibacillus soyae]
MTLTAPIISNAKITIPLLPSGLIDRPRLHRALESSLHNRVTPLCAPAGYGKTVSLAMWAQQAGHPCGWFAIDAMDNDEIRFWRYAARAAGKLLDAEAEERIAQLSGAMPTISILTFLDALLNELAGLKRHAALIFDDFHHIANERIHEHVAYFVDYMPEQLHLVLASRMALPFSARKRTGPQLPSDSFAYELSFTLEETSCYIRELTSLKLSNEQIARLQHRTEGWITGLQLAAASLRSGSAFDDLIASFKGDHRAIADYLFHEVVEQLPGELREFLLATAVLARMDAELCDALTQNEGSALLLESLHRSNLFLVAIDDQNGWFRYHPLFAEYISDRLKKSSLQQWKAMHARASEAMASRGFVTEAIEHAISAEEYAQLERLLQLQIPESMKNGEISSLLRWFDSFPDCREVAPELLLFHAFVLVLTGRLDRAEAMLKKLERIHSDMERDKTAETRCSELQSGILFVRSNLVFASGNVEGWFAFSEGILHRLAPENSAFYTFNYNISEPHVRRTAMGMNGVLSKETERMAMLFTSVLDSHGWEEALINLYVKLSLAEGYYEWNRLDDCRKLLRGIESAVFKRGLPGLLIPHRLAEARVHLALGKPQLAEQALEEAWEIANAEPMSVWREGLLAFQLKLRLQGGKLSLAKQAAEELGLSAADKPTFNKEYRYLAYVRLLGKLRKEHDAIRILERLRPQTEREGLLSSLAENSMLQAMFLYQLGHLDEAFPLLHEALAIGEANDYVRTFVDEGAPMKEMLERFRQSGGSGGGQKTIAEAYLDKLLGAFPAPKKPRKSPAAQLAEPLTRVEQELVRMLQLGASNKQIAEELNLSEGTVKVYLSNLYGKLGVSSRTQALLAAQKLGLISAT